jgi:hypothetical protein
MRFKTLIPLVALLLSCGLAQAQYNVVLETERTMSFGSRPCFRMEFANTDADVVEEIWKNYVKNTFSGKLKKDKKTGELFVTGLKSDMMGTNSFGIYSTLEKTKNGTALNAWYDMGSYFLNRRDNASRTEEAARSLKTFYFDVRRAALNKDLKAQESKLKEMENRQKKLAKENDDLHRDIENYKAKIKKAEDDIVKNDKEQEAVILDTETQRRNIEALRRRIENVENESN